MSASTSSEPRRRICGALLIITGLWGGLIPFVGPTFNFSMGSTPAWTWNESHATLHVAPAVTAILGGALLIVGVGRLVAGMGGLLAMLGGIWFVIAPSLHPLWASSASASGSSMGGMSMMSMGGAHTSATKSALEGLAYHYGTGAIIAVLGALALGVVLATRTAPAPAEQRETARARRSASRRPAQA